MATIKINQTEWSALNPEQQNQITGILQHTGLLEKEDKIVPDAHSPQAAAAMTQPAIHPKHIFCELACDAAEVAAIAACGLLSGPAAAVCVAAAKAGGALCRSKC